MLSAGLESTLGTYTCYLKGCSVQVLAGQSGDVLRDLASLDDWRDGLTNYFRNTEVNARRTPCSEQLTRQTERYRHKGKSRFQVNL